MGLHRRETSTRRCRLFRHPEVIATFDARRTREDDVQALLAGFEVAVAKGEIFEDGRLVRVGAGLLRVVHSYQGCRLAEPDFSVPELRFVLGVDATLAHMRAQEAMVAVLGTRPQFPELHQRVELCSYVDGHAFLVDRAPPTREDSGLCLACGGDRCAGHHPVVTLTVHEILCHFPAVMPFVALPEGATAAVLGGGDAILFHDGAEHVLRSDRPAPPSGVRSTRPPSLAPRFSAGDGDVPVLSGVRAMPGVLR